MTFWEINDIVDNIPYLDRALWEGSRLNAYVTAQVNSKNKMTLQDICKFKWEDMDNLYVKEEHDYEISTADINRLKELSTKFTDAKWEAM